MSMNNSASASGSCLCLRLSLFPDPPLGSHGSRAPGQIVQNRNTCETRLTTPIHHGVRLARIEFYEKQSPFNQCRADLRNQWPDHRVSIFTTKQSDLGFVRKLRRQRCSFRSGDIGGVGNNQIEGLPRHRFEEASLDKANPVFQLQ